MYHWAELDESNIVIRVLPGFEDANGDDGYQAIVNEHGGNWIKASDTAVSSGFRKNFPGPGYSYDEELDAFIPFKPYDSWILNLEEFRWDPPTPYPNDGVNWSWDESNNSWKSE